MQRIPSPHASPPLLPFSRVHQTTRVLSARIHPSCRRQSSRPEPTSTGWNQQVALSTGPTHALVLARRTARTPPSRTQPWRQTALLSTARAPADVGTLPPRTPSSAVACELTRRRPPRDSRQGHGSLVRCLMPPSSPTSRVPEYEPRAERFAVHAAAHAVRANPPPIPVPAGPHSSSSPSLAAPHVSCCWNPEGAGEVEVWGDGGHGDPTSLSARAGQW
jgi:hypothetical protein